MSRSRTTAQLGSTIAAAAAPAVLVGTAAAQFTFAPVINNPLPEGHTPTSLVLADLDADGKLDAVVTGRNLTDEEIRRTRVTILRGQGDGTFLPWQEVLVPGDTAIAHYRDWLKKWDAKGWRIDTKTLNARLGDHAITIPCPGREW